MTNVAAIPKKNVLSLTISEDELMTVLRNSLFVGAKDESIKMAVNYCRAAGLDIMQKPVHLVPMWDSKSGGMRDVVMPGIGLYRTQASRSNEMAGIAEPEFGEDVTENIGGVSITYPKWCKVIVKRVLPSGQTADFVAVERWLENYAVKGGKEKSIAPNAMWSKRPYGQIAKCAEAQALRKAFPELGAAPTAEEMEGRELDITPQAESVVPYEKPPLEFCTDDNFIKNQKAWSELVTSGKKTPDILIAQLQTKYLLTEEQKAEVLSWKKQEPVVIENEAVQTTDNSDFLNDYEESEAK